MPSFYKEANRQSSLSQPSLYDFFLSNSWDLRRTIDSENLTAYERFYIILSQREDEKSIISLKLEVIIS